MKITTILKSNHALTTKQGGKIRDRIVKKLCYGKRATIDCGGLVCVTSDFIHPITEILLLYSKDRLKHNVRFDNVSGINRTLVIRCIYNTLKTKNNDRQIK